MDFTNRRQSPRHRVLKDGKIVSMNYGSVFNCCIRDMSETGARLSCSGPIAVPNDFRLLVPASQTIRAAHVVWRRNDQVGIHFTGPAKTAPPRKW